MDKKILLIADDDQMSRMIIKQFLKAEYEIVEAENGRKALELLRTSHVDVMLLDIIMPEMDGLDVLKELKSNQEPVNVGILVATSTKEKTERAALDLGADDIVSKPYDPVVIKKRLSNILAVKEINRNFEMQQGEDRRGILESQLQKIQRKIDKTSDQIKRCTKLIAANRENVALLTEMLLDIDKAADKLETITKEQD